MIKRFFVALLLIVGICSLSSNVSAEKKSRFIVGGGASGGWSDNGITTSTSRQISVRSGHEETTLGAELVDGTGWTSTNWTGNFSDGFTHTAGNTSSLSRNTSVTAGHFYLVYFKCASQTAGTVNVSLGGVTSVGNGGDFQSPFPPIGAATAFWYAPKAINTNGLALIPTSDFDGTISEISVKEITETYSTAPLKLLSPLSATGLEIRTQTDGLVYPNTYLGASSGQYSTYGRGNTSLGYYTFYNNSSGFQNNAVGYEALYNNVTGGYNNAFGFQSMYSNVGGYDNSAFGDVSLYSNTSGRGNTAIGNASMNANTTGSYNTGLGNHALFLNTIGASNTAVGTWSLYNSLSGDYNVGVGHYASYYNTTGSNNVSVGVSALQSNQTGAANVAIGANSLYNFTGGGAVAIGSGALYTNASGTNNTAVGYNALNLETGNNCTALGYSALEKSTGNANTAVGNNALNANTTGYANTGVGSEALKVVVGGADNTGVGYRALYADTSGVANTAMGERALDQTSTQHFNSALGYLAGHTNTTGDKNTYLGATADANAGTYTQSTAVGYGATITANNQVVLGTATETVSVPGKWSPSFENITCTDSGNGDPGALTITPSKSIYYLTVNDANGCTVTMSETGAVQGQSVEIFNVSANTATFADQLNVLTLLATPKTLTTGQGVQLNYDGSKWVEFGGGGGSVSDAAYGVAWNGDTTTAPSKNAIYDKIETLAGGHDPVTLSAGLDSNLLGLSTQQITLDNQAANIVFAGPTTGAAAAPTFRSLVAADVPTLNQNTTGTAAGLTAAYIDWNAGSGGASILNKPSLSTDNSTANHALIKDAGGNIANSTATDTELSYVSGVTSAVQTQLNSKLASTKVGTVTNTKYCVGDVSGNIQCTSDGSTVYPSSGVATSTGSAWGSSGTGTNGNLMKWGASNVPTDGPKLGTLTDTKWCQYTTTNGLSCDQSAPAGGTITDNIWIPLGNQYQTGNNGGTGGGVITGISNNVVMAGPTRGSTYGYGAIEVNHAAGLQYFYVTHRLHDAWTGNVDIELESFSGSTFGDAYYTVATSCASVDDNLSSLSYNTESTAVTTYASSSFLRKKASFTSVNMTGCVAGDILSIRVGRDGTQGTDTLSGATYLHGLTLKVQHN